MDESPLILSNAEELMQLFFQKTC